MALFDLPLDQLRTYRPTPSIPDDLDAFWAETLAEARSAGAPPVATPLATPFANIRTYDVTFTGFAGQPVKGWLNVPAGADGPLPVVVEFIGYGGGRGLPHEWLLWPSAGYAHFVMDTRGQGAAWRGGDTPDPGPDGAGPSHPGFMTRGILDPHTYYYRRLFTDAVRAVESAAALPGVDATRLAVAGSSQGGALSLAAASLAPSLVHAVVSQVPFLCHIRRMVTLVDTDPFHELVRFFRVNPHRVAAAQRTLDYIDLLHLTPRASAPLLASAALMDATCPPSGIFAAVNAYGGTEKAVEVYEWDGHEGGRADFAGKSVAFVNGILKA
ncbi:acetylxylan esterase [Catenuloplanes japonicus]|uniref:acetylxylan esterase n=1 Tax=Catenuloplanes japonicus TaxID=33876 RepID=UPI0005261AA6|nr:alpha/beta fold hydrolase [Catenuloplanes japonicus]